MSPAPAPAAKRSSIKAYDGKSWSSAYSTTEKTTAPSGPSSSVGSLLGELGVSSTLTSAESTTSNSLSYNKMLTILQDAAVGGMTATKFSALQTLASMLNQSGGLTTSAYVQQIADDVINGNSANASWNGGSSTATKLGNLSATSTQTQVDELIGKWFLGTDLPSLSVSAIGESNYNPTYQDLDAAAVRPAPARRAISTSTRAISATATSSPRSAKWRCRTRARSRT